MVPELLLFTVGVFFCGGFAVLSGRWGPWRLMLTGAMMIILGGAWGLDMVSFGEASQRENLIGFGQIFLMFTAVISGALVSTAFNELRGAHKKVKSKDDV
ncbi:hypothetical protein [Alishewanella longhuensis]